ncbi:MAG: histone deacetylase [Roseivirga sp.]|nr:histone deacetylase [Roseivirga sp.]
MLKIAWTEIYAHHLPQNHRFPMEKYNLLPEQLIYEGTVTQDSFFRPDSLSTDLVLRTHDATYWDKLLHGKLARQEERRTGFPWSKELVQREVVIMQGTLDAALYALKQGVAMNTAGGTHHAFTDRGEGFCLLNDMAIAANYLLDKELAAKILVVDLDVHQGNGTAQIFRDEPRVFTFSMHGASNYPMHKELSDLDVGLQDGTDDTTYLAVLDQNLKSLFDKVQPDFVFFQSGVDVLATDKLGRLGMSIDGCKRRDRIVLELCKANEVPVMASMGGGYSEKISHIVEAHANTYRLAQEIFF